MDVFEENQIACLESRLSEVEKSLAALKCMVAGSLGDKIVDGQPCQIDRRSALIFLSKGAPDVAADQVKVKEFLDLGTAKPTLESVNAAFNAFYQWIAAGDRPVDDVNTMTQDELKEYFCRLVNPLIAG